MSVLDANSTIATRTAPSASTSYIPLLGVNRDRKGFFVQNNGTGTMYIAFGVVPTVLTDYSFSIATGQFFEMPYDFTGLVSAYWSVSGGNALVTEFS